MTFATTGSCDSLTDGSAETAITNKYVDVTVYHYSENTAAASVIVNPSSSTIMTSYYTNDLLSFNDISLNENSPNPCTRRFELSSDLQDSLELEVHEDSIKDYFELEYYEGETECNDSDITIEATLEPSG